MLSEIVLPVKMPVTRYGTKRPREPSLQLDTVFCYAMRRIGGRLRSLASGLSGVVVEIPLFA